MSEYPGNAYERYVLGLGQLLGHVLTLQPGHGERVRIQSCDMLSLGITQHKAGFLIPFTRLLVVTGVASQQQCKGVGQHCESSTASRTLQAHSSRVRDTVTSNVRTNIKTRKLRLQNHQQHLLS